MTRWPVLDEQYDDEFGPIASDVHAAAAKVWPQAESFAVRQLGDPAEAMSLMARAMAQVSRHRAQGGAIKHLSSYVYVAFRRLTLARKQEDNRHRELEESNQARLPYVSAPGATDVENEIFIDELRNRMDTWTRDVFDWRVLGHEFDEIARMKGVRPGTVRDRFHRNLTKLSSEMKLRG